ncbi:MAG: hypothetical protein QW579_02965 [Desulfurococcaceae archaeon]
MSKIDFRLITKKWSRLRTFAELTVESALNSIKKGHIDTASLFSGLQYQLPGTLRSVEKVFSYALVEASYGYVNKDLNRYKIEVDKVPGFEPHERNKIKWAFESLVKLGIADRVDANTIRIRPEVIDDIVRILAPFIVKTEVEPAKLALINTTYPYKVIRGISSIYVMYQNNKLPKCYVVATGLVSPVGKVDANGKVETKSTIDRSEWEEAKYNMSQIKKLRTSFESEHYLKALGFMIENGIIVRTYPIEILGSFIERVIKPAYEQYYRVKVVRKRRGA